MKRSVATALLFALLGIASASYADTIASFQAGTGIATAFVGQSVTTASTGGPWDNIVFNWYSDADPATTPAAFGTLFLLSQQFLGTPAALSSATTGYIAEAAASGGVYTFASSVTLQPGTQYFFYTNASGTLTGGTGNPYAGGSFYASESASSAFALFTESDANFLLQGTPVTSGPTAPVPEPASLILLGTGLASLAGVKRRKKQS